MLKDKALASMRRMTAAFNSLDDEGRQTSVIIALQHAFEMLLKAALRDRGVDVFDRSTGRSIGFEKCVRLSQEHLQLDDEQVGLLRPSMRCEMTSSIGSPRSMRDFSTCMPALP